MGNVKILVHRIDNDNLVIRSQKDISHFHLAEEGLTGTRNTEHESVSIDELFAVSNIDILRYLIDAVIAPASII